MNHTVFSLFTHLIGKLMGNTLSIIYIYGRPRLFFRKLWLWTTVYLKFLQKLKTWSAATSSNLVSTYKFKTFVGFPIFFKINSPVKMLKVSLHLLLELGSS